MATKKVTLTANSITQVVLGVAIDKAYKIVYEAFRGSDYDGGVMIPRTVDNDEVYHYSFNESLGIYDVLIEIGENNSVLSLNVDNSSEKDVDFYYNIETIK
jgi:hypothetical protein